MTYDEAVEQALCFGWVDSLPRKLDAECSMLLFTPRKPTSRWSRPNKERIARMEAAGQMTPAGRRLVDATQANGAWTALYDVENLVVPAARRGPLLVADVLGDPAVLLVEAETLVGLTLRGHPDQARGPDGAAVV